jgi:hypothetical protein
VLFARLNFPVFGANVAFIFLKLVLYAAFVPYQDEHQVDENYDPTDFLQVIFLFSLNIKYNSKYMTTQILQFSRYRTFWCRYPGYRSLDTAAVNASQAANPTFELQKIMKKIISIS